MVTVWQERQAVISAVSIYAHCLNLSFLHIALRWNLTNAMLYNTQMKRPEKLKRRSRLFNNYPRLIMALVVTNVDRTL